ncbi:hypothetical protein BH09BAC1_BH09BAC1_20680 [soil metagenome]
MRLLLLLSLLMPMCTFAQGNWHLQLRPQDHDAAFFNKHLKTKDTYNSETQLRKELGQMLLKLYDNGYLGASVDSLEWKGDTAIAWVFGGPQIEWVQLRPGNVDIPILSQAKYKDRFFTGQPVNYRQLNGLLNDILTYAENNGHPFAQVKLDSLEMTDSTLSASIYLQKNQLIKYDTIALDGDPKITRAYLYNYLGIRPGDLYDESAVKRIKQRLDDIGFLTELRPPEIIFEADKAKVTLYLQNRKTSRFDFLLGILPNNAISGRILFTGEANLELQNAFGAAEEIRLNWRKMQTGTQNLDIAAKYPYLFSLPIGIDGNFQLYKRDTLFLDINYELGLQYLFAGRHYIRAFFHNKATNVLNVDTTYIIRNRTLPEYNDVRNSLFGLEYYYERLDYRFNPRKGHLLRLSAGAGTRRIRPISRIETLVDPLNPDETFAFLYDSIKLTTVQYRFTWQYDRFWPIGRRSTLKTGMRGGSFISNPVFINELFRIGGSRLLRGFDEESIFVSTFNVLSAEFRFLLSKNSFFQVFMDAAYVEDRTLDKFRRDFPYGFGAGITFETKAGMFAVSYALGSQQGNPIDFRSSKVHFGYYNLF